GRSAARGLYRLRRVCRHGLRRNRRRGARCPNAWPGARHRPPAFRLDTARFPPFPVPADSAGTFLCRDDYDGVVISPGAIAQVAEWPELPYDAWSPTLDTLHMKLQVIGKIRLALTR